jgi:membrane protease subunit HflC
MGAVLQDRHGKESLMSTADTVKSKLGSFSWGRLILPIAAVLVVAFGIGGGGLGMTEIEPGEAAVLYNTVGWGIFGPDHRVIREQGTVTYVPWFQKLEVLDIRPMVLVMAGEQDQDETHVKRLTVRANDGSNFWFGKMEIHYQLDPAKADAVIENHGRGEAYKQSAVLTHAREVLRDEFGRYSFLQVADPSSYSKATSVSRTTLNQRLKPSGIEVSQIVTPKPSFSDDVEKAIRDRQTAEQAVLVFAKQRERLVKEKDRKTQEVREERNAEYQSLVAQLAAEQQQALNEFVSVQRQADTYAIGRVAEAKAIHAEKTTKAAANSEAAKERARGLAAQINAVGAAGPDVLNLEIARNVFPQLENITAVPYSRSTTPLDIRSLPAATKGD